MNNQQVSLSATDPDKIARLYSNLTGKKHRMAIFAHYRNLNSKIQSGICRLYKWEAEYGQLEGVLLCGWLDDELDRV